MKIGAGMKFFANGGEINTAKKSPKTNGLLLIKPKTNQPYGSLLNECVKNGISQRLVSKKEQEITIAC